MSSEYDPEFIRQYFGTVTLEPANRFEAGSYVELKFTITIGEYGFDDRGNIKLAWPVTNSFGIPQFDEKEFENYTTIETNGQVKLSYDFSHSDYIRPFMPCIKIKVKDGSLEPGEKVIITMGSQKYGGKGLKVQTYIENKIEFKTLLDPFGTNKYTRLPDSPSIDIVSNKPAKLTIIHPSEAVVGKAFWVLVRADDTQGNTADSYTGTITLDIGDMKREISLTTEDSGYRRIEDIIVKEAGVYYPEIQDTHGWTAKGSPLIVSEEGQDLHLFWGDLHGQTGETVGSGTIEEYLKFGREQAALDYISHAANAFQVTIPIWKNTQKAIKEFHEPSRYVTFLGYEWSGVTSAGGDHNVY